MQGVPRRWPSLLLTFVIATPALWHAAPAAGSDHTPDPLGEVTRYTADITGRPLNIAAGPDGNMWFTFLATDATIGGIGKITPTGVVTEYTAGFEIRGPHGIAAGPDGNMWFTTSGSVGKITPGGAVTMYGPANPTSTTDASIAAGPDGNMWFTEEQSNISTPGWITKVTPAGEFTRYPVQVGYEPHGVAAGPDGNIWFNEVSATGDGKGYIGKITPAGAVTEFEATPEGQSLLWIAAGPDGNMWFTVYGRPPGGKITPAGAVTLLPVAQFSNFGATRQIAAGPDGNMWVVGEPAYDDTGRIGSLTMAGEFTEYAAAIPPLNAPLDIAAGPDGNMWFSYWSFEPGAPPGGIGKIGTAVPVGPADANGDGVEDVLQPSGTAAGAFIDATLSPETVGSIVSMDAGVSASVVDAVNPDGVEITVSGPPGAQATFSLCGFATVQLSVGSRLFVTCGSLGLRVVSGSAMIVLNASTTLRVPSGVTAELTDTGSGFTVVSQGGTVTVTTNGVITVIDPGSVVAIDTSLPLVTFSVHPVAYTVDQTVVITCAASDGSGIVATDCPLVVNAPAYTLPLGPNTAVASATDGAGNTATASTEFSVSVTATSLCSLTHQFVQTSAKYQALPAKQRAMTDKLVSAGCGPLDAIAPLLSPKQRARLLTAYKGSVQVWVRLGWLTQAQATQLRVLADAL